jgi:hypothetical protein
LGASQGFNGVNKLSVRDAVVFNAGFSFTQHKTEVALRIFDEGYNAFNRISLGDIDHCTHTTFHVTVHGNEAYLRDLNAMMIARVVFQVPATFPSWSEDQKDTYMRQLLEMINGV